MPVTISFSVELFRGVTSMNKTLSGGCLRIFLHFSLQIINPSWHFKVPKCNVRDKKCPETAETRFLVNNVTERNSFEFEP